MNLKLFYLIQSHERSNQMIHNAHYFTDISFGESVHLIVLEKFKK